MSQISEGALAIPKHVFSFLLGQFRESRERGEGCLIALGVRSGVEGFVVIVAIGLRIVAHLS